MSKMTLTSLEGDYIPPAGLSVEDLGAHIISVLAAFEEQAEEQGLVIDWSTFSCAPDVEEFAVGTHDGRKQKERFTRLHFGIVAAKVED